MDPDPYEALPPAARAALEHLLAGNRRFVAGRPEHPNQDAAHRARLAGDGQRPPAVVLGCSDSRLAAEIIFDQGLGDLFVVRTVGHTVGVEALGSIEYGVCVLGAPLVVVLGHDDCGAVAAARRVAVDGQIPAGFLRDLIVRLGPEIATANARGITDGDAIGRAHVASTAALLAERSRLLADRVADGSAAIIGLSYALADGRTRVVTAIPLRDEGNRGAVVGPDPPPSDDAGQRVDGTAKTPSEAVDSPLTPMTAVRQAGQTETMQS
jgi:Carbonic anhydrase